MAHIILRLYHNSCHSIINIEIISETDIHPGFQKYLLYHCQVWCGILYKVANYTDGRLVRMPCGVVSKGKTKSHKKLCAQAYLCQTPSAQVKFFRLCIGWPASSAYQHLSQGSKVMAFDRQTGEQLYNQVKYGRNKWNRSYIFVNLFRCWG